MKICDLTQFYSPVSGGVKRYLEQKAAYLRRFCPGSSHVLIVPGETSGREQDGPCRTYTIRSPLVSKTSRYRALLDLGAVEQILELERPDIIESGDPYQVAWKAAISGRALGIPVVGFYHSHFPEAYLRSVARYFGKIMLYITEEAAQRYVRALYNRFERTLVPSPALASLLASWGVENTETSELGVDTDIFKPRAAHRAGGREVDGMPADKTILLYVGRLAAEKNVRTLLAAFRLLAAEPGSNYHLVCVGDGPLRSALDRLALETGAVSRRPYCADARELAAVYRSADLFVHPSVNETFGLVTLESQACGTPVVGIRGSYMDRIIFTDQQHWAAANNPAALAGAIHTMVREDLDALGRDAAAGVHARFSWQAVFQRLFAIYRRVCAEYNP